MNWKEIKEKCPKAFKCLIDWWSDAISTDFSKAYGSNFNDDYIDLFMPVRDLYDFFDKNDLYCQCDAKQTLDYSVWFIGYIWSERWNVNEYIEQEYQDRSEMEEYMFEKAFEILETKLSANSK